MNLYHSGRRQQMILNNYCLKLLTVEVDVSQGCVLGPFPYLY